MSKPPILVSISTRRERIAKLAREDPSRSLRSLAHHIDIEWLRTAYERTRKDGAPGVDGQTAAEYAEDLEGNLGSLLDRFKSGVYRAPAVRRVQIPKGTGGKTRPIGIPTFEDKVLQRAVVMVLESVYEEDFLDCSYGFRPGRSAHMALDALREHVMKMGGGWVLEVDIQNFFEELDHDHLRTFLDRRIRDGVLRRVIGKWLRAGVLEGGALRHPEEGTPQGGVISPLLANLYLHEVLDTWFEEEVKPRLRGTAHLVRYADDFVMVFAQERDAHRVQEVLPKRLARYGLRLHPDKTRLIRFQRPPRGGRKPPPGGRPGSFEFLGFTHHWGVSRRGNWVVKRRTASDRMTRSLRRIDAFCRRYRHFPLAWQQRQLASRLRGHYQYYGIRGNSAALGVFYWHVGRLWWRWLRRRSQLGMTWARFTQLRQRFPLPRPRLPSRRLAEQTSLL